jgi:hypothetical protein
MTGMTEKNNRQHDGQGGKGNRKEGKDFSERRGGKTFHKSRDYGRRREPDGEGLQHDEPSQARSPPGANQPRALHFCGAQWLLHDSAFHLTIVRIDRQTVRSRIEVCVTQGLPPFNGKGALSGPFLRVGH